MTRAVRLLILFALFAPVFASVGCDTKADSTPNPELGPPPTIPAGRGGGDKGIAPTAPPKGRQPQPPK